MNEREGRQLWQTEPPTSAPYGRACANTAVRKSQSADCRLSSQRFKSSTMSDSHFNTLTQWSFPTYQQKFSVFLCFEFWGNNNLLTTMWGQKSLKMGLCFPLVVRRKLCFVSATQLCISLKI